MSIKEEIHENHKVIIELLARIEELQRKTQEKIRASHDSMADHIDKCNCRPITT